MGAIYKNGILYTGGANVAPGEGRSVPTKQDLYTLTNTYRGMLVYVIDEDKYYRLVNDLPAFEASWREWVSEELVEMTDAEIDALFA